MEFKIRVYLYLAMASVIAISITKFNISMVQAPMFVIILAGVGFFVTSFAAIVDIMNYIISYKTKMADKHWCGAAMFVSGIIWVEATLLTLFAIDSEIRIKALIVWVVAFFGFMIHAKLIQRIEGDEFFEDEN